MRRIHTIASTVDIATTPTAVSTCGRRRYVQKRDQPTRHAPATTTTPSHMGERPRACTSSPPVTARNAAVRQLTGPPRTRPVMYAAANAAVAAISKAFGFTDPNSECVMGVSAAKVASTGSTGRGRRAR